MLPALASRFSAAVSVMQSITSWHEQQALKDQQKEQPFAPAAALSPVQSPRSRATEDISALFSVHHVTSTELMIRMVERVAGWLNEELSENVDQPGDELEVQLEKVEWRKDALKLDYRDKAAAGELSIPMPGENGVTFRQAARMILDMFNEDYLSTNRELKKELEDMIGFRLDGITVLDLLQAAVDPESEVAEKVDDVLSNGLAGMAGSKVSQRLERAAQGSQTVDGAITDALHKSPIDEVDEETLAEDREAIENARAHAKLDMVLEMQESASETAEDGPAPDKEAVPDSLIARAYRESDEASEDDEDPPGTLIML